MTKRAFIAIDGVDLTDDEAIDRWAESAWQYLTTRLGVQQTTHSAPNAPGIESSEK